MKKLLGAILGLFIALPAFGQGFGGWGGFSFNPVGAANTWKKPQVYTSSITASGIFAQSFSGDGSALTGVTAAGAVQKTGDTMTGNLTFDGGFIQFDTTPANPSHNEGQLFYDKNDKSLAYHNDEADITMQIGQEMWLRGRNQTGSTILNGQAIFVTGATGGVPTIALAKGDADATAQVIGLATHDIENNTIGYVTVFGLVRDIDTSAFSEGDFLHLSTVTAGALVGGSQHVIGPGFDVAVGKVVVANPVNGMILVTPHPHLTVGLGVANQIRAMNGAADAEAFKTLTVDPELTLSQSDSSISLGVDSSSVTLLGPAPDHDLLSNVTASQHHAKTVDASELTTGTLPNARLDSSSVTLLGPSIDAGELPMDGYASTYVNVAGDTMTGNLNLNADFVVQTSTMVVTGGRVGVGTTSPGSALEVVGQIRHSLGIISEGIGNGSVAGDSRGLGAIDLQTLRTLSTQTALGDFSVVAGGESNTASGIQSVVVGGIRNIASGPKSFVGGGIDNVASGDEAFIGGGDRNVNTASDGVIGGGFSNTLTGSKGLVCGGRGAIVSGVNATACGGQENEALGLDSFAIGRRAKSNADGTFTFGDSRTGDCINSSSDSVKMCVQGGVDFDLDGSSLTIDGRILHSLGIISEGVGNGSVAGDPRGLGAVDLQTIRTSTGQIASGDFSTISGGENNLASGIRSTVGGGLDNQAIGSRATVAGGNLNIANGSAGFIGGGKENTTGSEFGNFIGGGLQNSSSGGSSVVGGGLGNAASGSNSTVSGGDNNTASGSKSAVSGGDINTASGDNSAVPGGISNVASGDNSLAAGTQAKATTKGSFVWADSQGIDLITSATDQFLVRAQGGFTVDSSSATFTGLVGIGTTLPSEQLDVAQNAVVGGSMTASAFFGDGSNLSGIIVTTLAPLKGDGLSGDPVTLDSASNITISTLTVTGNAFSVNGSDLVVTGGDVGIGVASPARTLDVEIVVHNDTGPMVVFNNRDPNANDGSVLLLKGGSNNAASNILEIQDFNGNADLVVLGSGLVGIGTANPGSLLEVNGEMRAGQRTSADCCSDTPQRIGEFCYDTGFSDMFFSTGTVANQYKQVVGTANCG